MGKVKKKEVLERSKAFKDLIAVGLEKKNKANELLSTNKKLASRAKKFGINTAKANELIKKAQGIIENAEDIDDYDIASKELLKSRKYITDLLARHDQSSKLIVTLNGMIADMAKKGIGTTRLQKSLTKVKKHFTEMNYKMATELANKLIALGKKTEREFFTAQELIKEAEQLINESLNIEADIHEARELMKNAVSMVEEHNYSTAITIAKESI